GPESDFFIVRSFRLPAAGRCRHGQLNAIHACAEWPLWGGARQGGSFLWVRGPPGDSLQPEATGAGMEATKCLKPSDSGSRNGDRASVQAATRVNAEHASKRSMCRPTRRPLPGKADTAG